ncbi:type IV pilus assembly protein PilM [Candidatus Halobeggiatoa sp. HSG11]|nr:type IV pilus assembly protein PilM [Candidatus Halobeggiatoa sp. HSG11]
MSLLSLKPDPLVGIDISTTAIKLLELSKAGKGYKVESYGIELLPEKAIEDKKIDADAVELIGNKVTALLKRTKPKSQFAAVAISGPEVITKEVVMDKIPDTEMKEAIETDPATYLGQDIEDIELDFQVLGPNEREPEKVDVLLAACREETLEAHKTVLDLAGLKPKVIDIEKYALERAFVMIAKNDPDINEGEIIALIEIGATTATMNVLGDNQKIIYSHEEEFGGKQLIEQIQANYELTYEEAHLGTRDGGLPDSYETDILESFRDEMAQQISIMVQSYYSQSTYGKLSHILISGGCASIPDIVKHVETKVGGHVSVANPLASMSVASRVSKKALSNDAPSLMIACGLALRTFDEY